MRGTRLCWGSGSAGIPVTNLVADLHHFDDEQDPDPHQSERLDPDQNLIERPDLDPHQRGSSRCYRSPSSVNSKVFFLLYNK